MRKFAMAALAALTLTACTEETTTYTAVSANRVMDIVNNTNMTMTHFYASNTSRSTFPDLLGNSVLAAGRYVTINFDDGTGACWFDFKARFSSGQELTARVNVCVESRWVYS